MTLLTVRWCAHPNRDDLRILSPAVTAVIFHSISCSVIADILRGSERWQYAKSAVTLQIAVWFETPQSFFSILITVHWNVFCLLLMPVQLSFLRRRLSAGYTESFMPFVSSCFVSFDHSPSGEKFKGQSYFGSPSVGCFIVLSHLGIKKMCTTNSTKVV